MSISLQVYKISLKIMKIWKDRREKQQTMLSSLHIYYNGRRESDCSFNLTEKQRSSYCTKKGDEKAFSSRLLTVKHRNNLEDVSLYQELTHFDIIGEFLFPFLTIHLNVTYRFPCFSYNALINLLCHRLILYLRYDCTLIIDRISCDVGLSISAGSALLLYAVTS